MRTNRCFKETNYSGHDISEFLEERLSIFNFKHSKVFYKTIFSPYKFHRKLTIGHYNIISKKIYDDFNLNCVRQHYLDVMPKL